MKTRFEIQALLTAAAIFLPLAATAQPASGLSGEQREADLRVIAARCGTPAFEKAFFHQSRKAVAAGLVSRNRDPAEVEKTITALRRSPFVLVAAPADCPEQLKMLAEVQKARSTQVKPDRRK